MSRTREASGDGWSGSIRRSQLRTTSDGRSGLPSEKVRSGRRWNVTCRPSSLKRHDSARAGRTWRSASKLVSDSKSWAVIAALPESPWAAGSSVVGLPDRIRTGRSGPAAVDPPHEANSVAATRRTNRRRIAGSIGRVTECPPPGDRDDPRGIGFGGFRPLSTGTVRGLAGPHRRGNDGIGPRGLWWDNEP